jgi:3,4-dihydroxy 2-butanone 4-phosphate synthase / GTP cyclohydrolase II
MIRLDSLQAAVTALQAGRPVIVVDDEDRENEGDLIFAAELATTEVMAFTVRHSSGMVCVPMTGPDLDRLLLPQMVTVNADSLRTAYTITVDAASGVSTGISAADRARTARVLADPHAVPTDLIRPGHVFPLRARPGGVLERPGHTEAAVDLLALAGLRPVGVIAEVVADDGTMMRAPGLRRFADEHDLAMIAIEQLIEIRRAASDLRQVRRAASVLPHEGTAVLPTRHGRFVAHGFRVDGVEHVALVLGDVDQSTAIEDPPLLARVHSECLTGDAFGSLRCDCGPQLDESLRQIAAAGRGVVVYLRGHEGRGIGLLAKLQAYALQDAGADTVDANRALGLPVDARRYDAAARILTDLGVRRVSLLTNNPAKVSALVGAGLAVERRPLEAAPNRHNSGYLRTKRDRLGHQLVALDGAAR